MPGPILARGDEGVERAREAAEGTRSDRDADICTEGLVLGLTWGETQNR